MPKCFLVMQRGANIGAIHNLKNGHTSLGRNPDNDIIVEEVAVSRYHATIHFDEKSGDLTVMDLGSTNGVTVNNVEIKSGTPFKLQQRDTVFIGRAVYSVQLRSDNQPLTSTINPRQTDRDITQRLNLPVHYREGTKKLTSVN